MGGGLNPGLPSPAVLMCVSRKRNDLGPHTLLTSNKSWVSQLRFILHVPTQGPLRRSLSLAGAGRSESYLRRAHWASS